MLLVSEKFHFLCTASARACERLSRGGPKKLMKTCFPSVFWGVHLHVVQVNGSLQVAKQVVILQFKVNEKEREPCIFEKNAYLCLRFFD